MRAACAKERADRAGSATYRQTPALRRKFDEQRLLQQVAEQAERTLGQHPAMSQAIVEGAPGRHDDTETVRNELIKSLTAAHLFRKFVLFRSPSGLTSSLEQDSTC